MSAKLRLIWGVVFLVILPLVGCVSKTSASGNALVGSREVTFSSDGAGSISETGDSASVSLSGVSVTVEKARLLVDGKEVAKVPEDAKVVAVNYAGGTLRITADGAKAYEVNIGK